MDSIDSRAVEDSPRPVTRPLLDEVARRMAETGTLIFCHNKEVPIGHRFEQAFLPDGAVNQPSVVIRRVTFADWLEWLPEKFRAKAKIYDREGRFFYEVVTD